MRLTLRCVAVLLPALLLSAGSASAGLIANGGFESGLSSWTKADMGDGSFFAQTGATSPENGDDVPAPPEGTTAAMSDGGGSGSHVLYQDFVVPTTPVLSASLSFQMFIGNRSSFGFTTPASGTLDYSILTLNQQVRVDILKSTAGAFSVAAADVLKNIYQSKSGDALVTGYNLITTDLTSLLQANQGSTLRLRFTEVDNALEMQLGVDDVKLDATLAPEPSTFASAALAIVGFVAVRRRRKTA